MENIKLPKSAMKIAYTLKNAGYEVYVVGGAVRDFCLGLKPHDIDFATNATPDEIEKTLKDAKIPFTSVGKKFGTIVGRLDDEYEITTYRNDGSSMDGRHPDEVTFASTIEDDLSRRDFTMNAMAFDPFTKEIIDPFGGMEDMRAKVLAFVGNTEDRIREDGLRMMRALRFSIKYGLDITKEDEVILKSNAHLMDNISKERKTDELRKILTCGKPIAEKFATFPELVFKVVPELEPTYKCSQINKYHKHDVYEHILHTVDLVEGSKFEIKLAALLHDIGKPATKAVGDDGYEHFFRHPGKSKQISEEVFAKSLVVPNNEKELVLNLVEHHDTNFFLTEKQLRRTIAKYGEDFLHDLLVLQTADRLDHVMPPDMSEEKKRAWFVPMDEINAMFDKIHNEKPRMSLRDLSVKGKDLLELGYKGEEIGRTLKEMLSAVIDGTILNNKEELIATFCTKENTEQNENDMEM